MPGKRTPQGKWQSRWRGKCALLLLLLALFLPSRLCLAHPMGNFSVNHYSKITLAPDGIHLQYFIDLAEIPTYQELQQYDIPATPGMETTPAISRFLAQRGAELERGLSLRAEGATLPLRMVSKGVIFPPGAGGLPTMKIGYTFRADYPHGSGTQAANLAYSDGNYAGRAGWKEIVVAGPPALLLNSSAPAVDRSAGLSDYPTDMLNSPPQDLTATAHFALPVLGKNKSAADTSLAQEPAAGQDLAAGTGVVRPAPHGLPIHNLPANSLPANGLPPRNLPPHGLASGGPEFLSNSAHGAGQLPSQSMGTAGSLHRPVTAGIPPTVAPAPASLQAAPVSTLRLQANRQGTARSAFTELVTTQRLGLWFLFTAAFISMGLGAMHALEPGHGKTIVAAYLVGSRGTARHAVLLGVIVTAAHTASVFALGAITLYASRYVLPEQLYPWLGVLSGLTIAMLGGYMLMRRATGEGGMDMDHAHAAGEMHGHWFTSRKKQSDEKQSSGEHFSAATSPSTPTGPISLTQLFTLGITGGIIPCPAALVVLLSAFALHRVGFGFFLITAFSVGLAAVLIGFGLLMVYARRFMGQLQMDGPLTKRWLPVASAGFMTILGLVIAVRAWGTTGLTLHSFSQQRLGPALFVAGLGLVLGIRHSTDTDHVVAISTIVTRQRSIRGAALIGSLWGLGHTLTIFVVGCLIILCGVVIPPRIGLSMEFSVALMLILLGLLNLTGVMGKIVARFSPGRSVAGLTLATQAEALPGADTFAGFSKEEEAQATRDGRFVKAIKRYGSYQILRPLAIGLVHGLAGSAAVALLVLSTIHNPLWAVVYLLIFGGGTMLGMMCMTAAMALPLVYAGDRMPQVSRYLGVASGLVSVCFGAFLVYQLGYVGGLFTSHPHWTPQ